MKKVLTSIAVLAALAAGFVLLTGFRGGCGGHHHADAASVDKMIAAHIDDALDDLKATDAQRAQVLALKDKYPLLKGGALHQGQAEAKKALVAQWDLATPDPAAVHALVDARIEAIRAFAHQAADAGLDLHGILTPEQRAQVSKKIHRRMDDR
jgi:Spy/CpxP family protein refolding chaperone